MTWLVAKKTLKKTWTWLKHNWYVPVVVIYTLVLWLLFRKGNKAKEVLDIRSKSYEAQINAINEAHKEEIQKRDEILKKYDETIKKIEEEFAKKNEELDNKKRKTVKELVKKHYNEPDALAKMIAEEFNFEYVE
tara:strand:- start:423 stop:824 length:402 start_codon:yes stop_codon:yes gene_type:complete